MTSDSTEYVMENNGELEELEITETDAALLRDLLEEWENEENIDTKENCLIQSAVDETNTTSATISSTTEENYDAFDIEHHHHHHELSDFSWAEQMMAETSSSSLALPNDDVVVPDWYAGADSVVGMVGFEYCNNIGDYSYLYNETTYCRLWEEE